MSLAGKHESDKGESLYMVNPEVLLREDSKVKVLKVNCRGYMEHRTDCETKSVCHPMLGCGFGDDGKWPETTSISCNHCCHPFVGMPVPIPREYDEDKQLFLVFGVFCSFNCAKQYIIEREPMIATNRLVLFRDMCSEVFGVTEPTKPAPPALVLKKFMGENGITIEQFRDGFLSPKRIVMEKQPFVRSPNNFSIWDEYRKESSGKEIILDLIQNSKHNNAFSAPQPVSAPKAMFGAFLSKKRAMDVKDQKRDMDVEEAPQTPLTETATQQKKKKKNKKRVQFPPESRRVQKKSEVVDNQLALRHKKERNDERRKLLEERERENSERRLRRQAKKDRQNVESEFVKNKKMEIDFQPEKNHTKKSMNQKTGA
jgi:hypothetical protein